MKELSKANNGDVSSRRPKTSLAILLCAVCSVACGDDEGGARAPSRGDSQQGSARCAYDVLEPDLELEPLAGPAVDRATGKLKLQPGKRYMVSSTYGVPKPGADGTPVPQRYRQMFGAIQQQLAQQPGLLAMALAQSPSCGSGRTLAVWESEELMYDFVTSPAHLAAMRDVDELVQPGYGVTHWEASAPEQMTFQEGVRQLAK